LNTNKFAVDYVDTEDLYILVATDSR